MAGWLLGNLRLKLIAVAVAAFLWGGVAYAQNPTESRTLSVPVSHTPPPSGIVLIGPLPPVNVRIVGPQDAVRGFDVRSMRAVADLRGLTKGPNRVPLDVVTGGDPKVQLENPPTKVLVVGDELGSVNLPVGIRTVGNPAEGYRLVDSKVSPKEITAVGPRSLLSGLTAYISVDVADRRNSLPDRAVPVLLETQAGQRPPSSVGATPPEVVVGATIESTSVKVPRVVRWELTGRPADGYRIETAYADPAYVDITGIQALVDPIPSVPTEPIDVTGATQEVVKQVALRLPAGVKTSRPTVTVHVLISKVALPSPSPSPNPTR
jgi:YbbR domain-containing protein